MNRITFGIIALNAQPFLEYNLKSLYPFAHQIIVVEGATRAATSIADKNGHSTDDTLLVARNFARTEDPLNKLSVITAIDDGYGDGFWPEKDEMSQAYAKRVTGDWLWQVDSDEFYKTADLKKLIALLDSSPKLSGISFPFREFWGGFDYVVTGQWYLYEFTEVQRVFRWGTDYQYAKHRPPTVVDAHGELPHGKWLTGKQLARQNIFMYHYSYVFPKQAQLKVGYYSHVSWTDAFKDNRLWLEHSYFGLKRPLFLGERGWPTLQWLERYKGTHPEAIEKLKSDLRTGKIHEPIRPTVDIERLLATPFYRFEKAVARLFLVIYWPLRVLWKELAH